MKEFYSEQYRLDVPEGFGGGFIEEADYQPTAGTDALIRTLLEESPHINVGLDGIVGQLLHPFSEEHVAEALSLGAGSDYLRLMHDTEGLCNDRYDIAEAIRLTSPIANLITAKQELGAEVSTREAEFIARSSDLGTILDVLDEELEMPYRKVEQTTRGVDLHIEGGYSIEDEVVDAVDLARRMDAGGLVGRLETGRAGITPTDAEIAVRAFYAGELPAINFSLISLVHTLSSADAIDEISSKSAAGSVSARAAGPRRRELFWFGKQVELDQDYVSVVAGGNASQN